MENYYYQIYYLNSLNREELLNLMFLHDYEKGYEEYSNDELIEVLSNIVM